MLARFIALRYAQARSGSALLGFISRVSMAGLVVAVALLITVLAVMNGFEHELRTRILRVVPAITLYPEENEIAEWKVVAQEVLKNPQNPEYDSIKKWLGAKFDPNFVDTAAINHKLAIL